VCTCAGTQTLCGSACTNMLTDPGNCGACGNVCPAGGTCSAGVCSTSACGPGAAGSACGCPNFQTDPNNCGACGIVCASGSCLAGQCATTSCPVAAPVNGTLGSCPSLLASGSTCQFACNAGYGLTGAATSCANGVLTAQACGSPCSVTPPVNASMGTCPSSLPSGSSCQISCADGYTTTGATTSCANGILTTQACAPSSCTLTAPSNGTLGSCPSVLASGSTCAFACNAGYSLSGASTSCNFGQVSTQTCTPSCVPPPSGIVSWWTGDDTPADFEGANNATLSGDVTYVPGMVGDAFQFQQAGYAFAGSAGLPIGSSDRTMECWVELDSAYAGQIQGLLFGYGQTFDGGGMSTLLVEGRSTPPGELSFSQWGGGVAAPTSTATGVWYHVAVTVASGLTSLYINGALVDQSSLGFNTPSGTTLYIGGGMVSDVGTMSLNGAIDEATIYSRALSAAEIQSIYQAGSLGKCK
jgi:hypothetical protein